MENNATLIYYSPTGGTKKVLNAIAEGMGFNSPEVIDLTLLSNKNKKIGAINNQVVIIGAPVYQERIPEGVISSLQSIKGTGQAAVLVAVCGNIGSGIALKELSALAEQAGLVPIGAANFVAEHSFSKTDVLIAQGRPDNNDLAKAKLFGQKLLEKLNQRGQMRIQNIPGYITLMTKMMPPNAARLITKPPKVNLYFCNRCNACAEICPVQAIDRNTLEIDTNLCTRCFACVKKCPNKGRKIEYRPNWFVSWFLKTKSKRRMEPTIII